MALSGCVPSPLERPGEIHSSRSSSGGFAIPGAFDSSFGAGEIFWLLQAKGPGDEARPLWLTRCGAVMLGSGGLEAGLEVVEFLAENGGDGIAEFCVVSPDGRDILEPGVGIDGEQLGHVLIRKRLGR